MLPDGVDTHRSTPSLVARLASGPNLVRTLQGAAIVHVTVLVLALFSHLSLHSLALIVSGLAVILLALQLPRLAQQLPAPQHVVPAPSVAMPTFSQLATGEPAGPSPLPFMGERILLNPEVPGLDGLSRAAARLSRMTPVRAHPWGDLIARVSHELRTPLNAVIGFSDVMQSELLGPVGHPRYREYARHIRDCGRELLKSAEDTLAITCLLGHDPSAVCEATVDFHGLVAEAWLFHAEPGMGLTLEADIPEGISVLADRRPLRQILINLFAEAVRRSDSQGLVGITATVDGDLVQIEVFLRGRPDSTPAGQASLPICLARALLELQGAALIEVDDPYSTWRALTVLRRPMQSDFFPLPELCEAPPARLC